MATYRMQDGTVVKTESAVQSWEEAARWNGNNHISVHTGSQWTHQTLHKTRKGRYYIEYTSQWQGSTPHAEFVSPEEAARWLILNGDDLPEDLKPYEDEVTE
jgi:hypothetical protein